MPLTIPLMSPSHQRHGVRSFLASTSNSISFIRQVHLNLKFISVVLFCLTIRVSFATTSNQHPRIQVPAFVISSVTKSSTTSKRTMMIREIHSLRYRTNLFSRSSVSSSISSSMMLTPRTKSLQFTSIPTNRKNRTVTNSASTILKYSTIHRHPPFSSANMNIYNNRISCASIALWNAPRTRIYEDENPINDMNSQSQFEEIQRKVNELTKSHLNLNSPKQIANALYNNNNHHHLVDDLNPKETLSTSKDILQQFANGTHKYQTQRNLDGSIRYPDTTIASFQKELASLVLQYRSLKNQQKKQRNTNSHAPSSMEQLHVHPAHPKLNHYSMASYSTSSPHTSNTKNMNATTKISTQLQKLQQVSKQKLTTTNISYSHQVENLFTPEEAVTMPLQIHPYWKEALQTITKPSAQALIGQLHLACPMGYDPTVTLSNTHKRTTTTATAATAGKKGSLLSYVRDQKQIYPTHILLIRVGEFYESFGIDAILLIEHCGLNPMGNKARAGCPIRNIQSTLDGLTNAGYSIAVYEEINDITGTTSTTTAKTKPRLKHRMLAQMINPANPTYLYNFILEDSYTTNDVLYSTPSARPYIGIIHSYSTAGYAIVEVSMEERTVRVTERVTADAVICRLAATPPSNPLFYVPSLGEDVNSMGSNHCNSLRNKLPFLPSRWEVEREGAGAKQAVKILSPNVYLSSPKEGTSDIERYKQCIVQALLQATDIGYLSQGSAKNDNNADMKQKKLLTHEDFTLVSSNTNDNTHNRDNMKSDVTAATFTNPLYHETASQLGLMSVPTIPNLIHYVLPTTAPPPTRQFLRRWLLTPPPPSIASAMSTLVQYWKEDSGLAIPSLDIPPVGKVLSLIRAGQASAQLFRGVLKSLESTVCLVDILLQHSNKNSGNDDGNDDVGSNDGFNSRSKICDALMSILRYESGMDASPENLKNRVFDVIQIIEEVVSASTIDDGYEDLYSGEHLTNTGLVNKIANEEQDIIPPAFFSRNEQGWRGRIKPEVSMNAYENVEAAVYDLLDAVAIDFWGANGVKELTTNCGTDDAGKKETKSPIVQDIFNNLISLREIPKWAEDPTLYYHPRDRNGKLLRNRYTTKLVEDAISSYVEACESASVTVSQVLGNLSENLCDTGHLPAITQAAHVNLIVATACQHAAQANYLGWNLAEIVDESHQEYFDDFKTASCKFVDLHPYWMDRSEAVLNSFELDGLFLLTAPNMSGKSTIMRSAAAAAILSNCGFCSPVGKGSFVKRFDSIFVRGASADVPMENKSAFGAEMGDIAALLRACGPKSLVFVDELGRGTSAEDGASLAGAIMETMSISKMNGFFATHLHSIVDLPLCSEAKEHICNKQMEICTSEDNNDFRWTYKLIDGVCKDSRALKTAAQFGIPSEIIQRAEELSTKLNVYARAPKTIHKSLDIKHSIDRGENYKTSLSRVNLLVREMSQEECVIIPPRWSCPPAFEGGSVVYVLHVGDSYYVGETDSLSRRIRQHRSKGGLWAQCSTFAMKVSGGKSNARNLESRIIQKMAQNGYLLLSTADGRSVKPLKR